MASRKDPVAVIGLGRFGSALALELARQGTEVLAIDNGEARVQHFAGKLAQVVVADSTDMDALRELGVGDFPRVVVAIGADLQASILTTSLLVELEVPHIWAKALSRQHASILERIGAHHVVQPEYDMGERVAHLVSGRMLDYIELTPQWVFVMTKPPQDLTGVPLGRSGLRSKHRITVVSVKPEHSEYFTHADLDTVLNKDDQIVISGRPDDVERYVDRR